MTDSRADLCVTFLTDAGWGNAKRALLAGDASNRRYDRLDHPTLGRAVLMDAPPEKGEDVRPFIRIALHLRDIGLSAPKIIAEDTKSGFLIIEDLGDDLFARVLERDLSLEQQLYTAATNALHDVQNWTPPKELQDYGPEAMAETALLAMDWYLQYATGAEADDQLRSTYRDKILSLLQTHLTGPKVLVQRDYHAENLLWLPKRKGSARVGLLDFQDAMLGHPAYDLASLLKDARRDVTPQVQQNCIDHFTEIANTDPAQFAAAYAICSAQRNLRIVGVFTRLCVRDGKSHYPDMIPRVWRNLQDDLTHPALEEFREWIADILPPPDENIIQRIKSANA